MSDWTDSTKLLPREYKMQPKFHNAMRDHIVFVLLPGQRFEEAEAIARQIPRAFASEALLSLISMERAYRRMSAAEAEGAARNKHVARTEFCDATKRMRSVISDALLHIRSEPDVSYNNILRTLERLWRFVMVMRAILVSIRFLDAVVTR